MRLAALLLMVTAMAAFVRFFAPEFAAPAFAALIYVLLGLAAKIEFGWAGLPDFSLLIWFAAAAVASDVLIIRFGFPLWAALPVCAILAAIAAAVLISHLQVLRPELFAIATFAAASLVAPALTGFRTIIGIPDVPRLGEGFDFSLLAGMVVVVAAGLAIARVSSIALGLRAIGEDRWASLSIGLNLQRYRTGVAAASAALAAVAGCFWPAQFPLAPKDFGLGAAASIFAIAVLAGRRISGVILPAILIGGIPQLLPGLSPYRTLIAGASILVWVALRRIRLSRRPVRAEDGGNLLPAEVAAE